MAPCRPLRLLSPFRCLALMLALALVGGVIAPAPAIDLRPPDDLTVPAVLEKDAPENLQDLKALQKQVRAVLERVQPCVVGLRMGASQGSGVIISKDGYVLTAGHVSGAPNKDCKVVLHDGREVKAKTLGANNDIDSGMVKITEGTDWPFLEMGKSANLKNGQWCVASGHPGGYKTGRSPVVRVGRIVELNLDIKKAYVRTDCTLVGGDSGGPLFDLHGRVIGIHSRIGGPITANLHVPVDTYRDTWDRLAKAEIWGGQPQPGAAAFMGLQTDPNIADKCKVVSVQEGGPADKAGIKANDIITSFDGQKVGKPADLGNFIAKKRPNDKIQIEVLRGEETVTLEITLGRRPAN